MKTPFKPYDVVAVTGTVVHAYSKGHAYEVEITDSTGESVTLTMDNYRLSVPSFTCPQCGRTSHNLNDVQNNYCGHCHLFWGDKKTTKKGQ